MLSDVKVAKLKYQGERGDKLRIEKHPDRDGLYLAVSPPRKGDPKSGYGSKVFRWEFRWPATTKGKRQTLTYGRYPELSLSEAREKHLEARKALAKGINPAEKKQERKQALADELEKTYGKVAAAWFAATKVGKSNSWTENNERWLKAINKTLENKPLSLISDDHVMEAVKPLLDSGYAFSADRARQQIALVFAFARRRPWRFTGINPAREVKGEIRVPDHKNHAHIKVREVPELLKALDGYGGTEQSKILVRLLLLTAVRKTELIAAKKKEFDLDAGIFDIPAERMKNKIPHIVPLSRQVLELVKRQMELSGNSEFLFPNTQYPKKHAGKTTPNDVIDNIGFQGRLTPHGFRSVFSTETNGTGAFRMEVIERQLSHIERNKVRGAYNKADYLDERKRLMQFWADRVDHLCAGTADSSNVVQLQPKAAA